MSKNTRRRHGAILNLFNVGRADAASSDFDEQFICTDARDRHGFNAQVVHTAIDDGAHGFWNIEHAGILTTDYTDGHGFFKVVRRLRGFHRFGTEMPLAVVKCGDTSPLYLWRDVSRQTQKRGHVRAVQNFPI